MTNFLFKKLLLFLFISLSLFSEESKVELGVDLFFKEKRFEELKGKRVALLTNQTGVNSQMRSTIDLFLEQAPKVKLVALFAPEHGIKGHAYAFEEVEDKKALSGIPIYTLEGTKRRPTLKMLEGIDLIIYDIQDIGCRTYTYTTTLFFVMEEAAKKGIPVMIFDRPNPMGGTIVDGPMLEEKWRSFIGYVNVPYCHGMTVGELAKFFNEEYQIGCTLKVIPMRGWKRAMSFKQTGLQWIPTSPYIPEPDTPLYYATTGIIGELGIVNIGIGYTTPFKVVGAPWIKAEEFAEKLNAQKLPGVHFLPFHFRPFYGIHKGKDCEGVKIFITDTKSYRPLMVQYMLLGLLKNLYPREVKEKITNLEERRKDLFCKANGNEAMLFFLQREKYVAWKLILYQKEERDHFRQQRRKYLLYP